ncbi:MAG: hypothetical protein ACREBC_17320 [Pyrinomonadaceae bacterium]
MMSTQNENSTSTITLSPEVVRLLIADLCLPEIDAAYHINVNSTTISNVPNDGPESKTRKNCATSSSRQSKRAGRINSDRPHLWKGVY